jgi:hypothetical protein
MGMKPSLFSNPAVFAVIDEVADEAGAGAAAGFVD